VVPEPFSHQKDMQFCFMLNGRLGQQAFYAIAIEIFFSLNIITVSLPNQSDLF
jgi:hypothetical protein